MGATVGGIGEFARAKWPRRIPVVLSHVEVRRLLDAIKGDCALMTGADGAKSGRSLRPSRQCPARRCGIVAVFVFLQVFPRPSTARKYCS